MVIFHCYVSSPEGKTWFFCSILQEQLAWWTVTRVNLFRLRRMDDLCIGPEDSPDTLKVFRMTSQIIPGVSSVACGLVEIVLVLWMLQNVAIAVGFNVKDLKHFETRLFMALHELQVAYLRVFEFRYFCQRPWRTLLALRGGICRASARLVP